MSHWTDGLYGAEKIDLVLDTSGDIVKIVSAKIHGGYSYFDSVKQSLLPSKSGSSAASSDYVKLDNGFNGITLLDRPAN